MDAFGRLGRVYVRPPVRGDLGAWRAYGWHAHPDAEGAEREHAALRALLAETGAEVVVGNEPVPGDPDAIYAYDPTLVLDAGVVLLRPGKEGRRGEPSAIARDLRAAGLDILESVRDPGTAEGGDMLFLDATTLCVGLGYRTNTAGVEQLRAILEPHGVSLEVFDLPHYRGPAECLHLMSFISVLDADLVVAYPPMLPVRLKQLLDARGFDIVEVPHDEWLTMGPNVLALGPRRALALAGNPVTKERMEAAGVEVLTYEGRHISLNGDGGPTCLTRPLMRG